MAKKFGEEMAKKFAFFLTEFLVCRTKQRFLSMFMIILSLGKKSLKKKHKILESKIQSIVMTFGLFGFLVSGFFIA